MDCSRITIDPDQRFEIWGLQEDDDLLAIAFDDPGDDGFLRLGRSEAADLVFELESGRPVKLCGYTLSPGQAAELKTTIGTLLDA